MGRRSKYPEEFRRNAAKLALDGGQPIRKVFPKEDGTATPAFRTLDLYFRRLPGSFESSHHTGSWSVICETQRHEQHVHRTVPRGRRHHDRTMKNSSSQGARRWEGG
jgi:transposase-like protein